LSIINLNTFQDQIQIWTTHSLWKVMKSVSSNYSHSIRKRIYHFISLILTFYVLAEERVLELGNKVLEVLGAEDKISEIEHFQSDSLYLQLFQALFPQFDFEEIEPGNSEEEMTENIAQLIKLLETNILDTDLSDIKAEEIVSGNLMHIDEFLQVLLQVVFLMIQNQAEGEESEESIDSMHKKNRDKGSSSKKARSDAKGKGKISAGHSAGELDMDDNKDETDTQKLAADLGLNSPDMEDIEGKNDMGDLYDMPEGADGKDAQMLRDLEQNYEEDLDREDFGIDHEAHQPQSRDKSDKRKNKHHDDMDEEEHRFSDLDFYGKNPPDHKQVMIDDDEDEEALLMKQAKKKMNEEFEDKESPMDHKNKKGSDGKSKASSNKKAKKGEVDVLNDPLLPEGVDFGQKKKNKQRADSLGGGGSFKGGDLMDEGDEDDDLLVIDNLDELDEEQKYMVLQHLFEEYQKDPESFPEEQRELLEEEMMKLYQKAEREGEFDEEESEDDLRMASSSKKKSHKNGSDVKAKPRPLHEDSDGGSSQKASVRRDEDQDDDEYMDEIIQQQQEAQAEREEQQQQLEQDQQDYEEELQQDIAEGMQQEHEMEGEGEEGEGDEQMQAFEINEEEFNKLSPEEQQQMLMILQQQQQMAQQEMEGEGEGDAPDVNQEYLNALQQQIMQQQEMSRGKLRKKSKKGKKKRPSTAKYGLGKPSRMASRSM